MYKLVSFFFIFFAGSLVMHSCSKSAVNSVSTEKDQVSLANVTEFECDSISWCTISDYAVPGIYQHPLRPDLLLRVVDLGEGRREVNYCRCPEGLIWNPELEICHFPLLEP